MIWKTRQRNFFSRVKAARRAFAFVFLPVFATPISGQVRVWEGVLKLLTYEEGAPDPNPPFDQFSTGRFNYPYTLRNEITDTRVEHEWRAVYLENRSEEHTSELQSHSDLVCRLLLEKKKMKKKHHKTKTES